MNIFDNYATSHTPSATDERKIIVRPLGSHMIENDCTRSDMEHQSRKAEMAFFVSEHDSDNDLQSETHLRPHQRYLISAYVAHRTTRIVPNNLPASDSSTGGYLIETYRRTHYRDQYPRNGHGAAACVYLS